MISSNKVIEIQNLTRKFGDRVILNNLNFTVHEGEFVAILGASGSGKSTLLNILGLLDNQFSGSYDLLGERIKSHVDYTPKRASSIGFIFQLYYLMPKLSITDNILLPHLYLGQEKKSVVEKKLEGLIDRLSLGHILNQPCEVLSGGEKQRVAIARALVHNPSILICDEPTGNLDEHNGDNIITILKEEQQSGKTIIVVTHSLKVAKYADKVFLLEKGGLTCVEPMK